MKRHRSSWPVVFLCCLLAVPTVEGIMAGTLSEITLETARPALMVGAVLGALHLLLRPALRLITAPLGCLTFGLFGLVIDVALIYAAAGFVDGYRSPGMLCAVLTAALINIVCGIAR